MHRIGPRDGLRCGLLQAFPVCSLVIVMFCLGCTSAKDSSRSLSFKSSPVTPVETARPQTPGSAKVSPRESINLDQAKARLVQITATQNRAAKDRSIRLKDEIKLNGGMKPFIQKELALKQSELRLSAGPSGGHPALLKEITILNGYLQALIKCQSQPMLFGTWLANGLFVPDNIPDFEDFVTPGDEFALVGCGFGVTPGKVTLTLTSGQQFELPVQPEYTDPQGGWTNFTVWVAVPYSISGVVDQKATLRLTDSSNQESDPVVVQFVAARDMQILNSSAYPNLVGVDPHCPKATTEDKCGNISVGDPTYPDGRTYFTLHLKSCCHKVSGTDTYYAKLYNGWTALELDPYFGTAYQNQYDDGLTEFSEHGFTTCWWFGNKPGFGYPLAVEPPENASYTFQVQFTWNVDSVCSGVDYETNQIITGPVGVPYYQ